MSGLRFAVGALALGLVSAVGATARRPAGKNVKVLVDLEPEALYGAMLLVSGSLGVACDHCHASGGFELDEKPAKATARAMMRMTAELRQKAATRKVSCFTCHRGQPTPVSIPGGEIGEVAAGGPPLDEVLARYRRATADDARLGRLTTIVMKGSSTFTNRGVAGTAKAFEIALKLPDKRVRTEGTSSVGVNGANGWRQIGDRGFPLGGIDLAQARRDAAFAAVADLGARYQRMSVAGDASVRGTPVVVVEAVPREPTFGPLQIDSERLFFEPRSGHLVRRELVVRTAVGLMPLAVDYGDFRDVDGVSLPFRIDRQFSGGSEAIVIDDIALDRPLPDERFEPPRP